MTGHPGEPIDDFSMSSTVIDALELAVVRDASRATGTLHILLAILTVDLTWGWESVQIAASFVTEDDLERYADPHPQPGGTWRQAPLTTSATHSLRTAAAVASLYGLDPMPTGVLALGLLADPGSAASVALLANTSIDHGRLLQLIQEDVLDTNLEGLDLTAPRPVEEERPEPALELRSPAPRPTEPPPATSRPAKPAARAGRLGFDLGTFLGAFVVSLIGGVPLVGALALAFGVRTVAIRARRRRRDSLLASLAVLCLIGALVLAVTSITGFGETREALGKLELARAAIGEDRLVPAMKDLADADLLENESESITVLASCVDWALGYTDYSLSEAQVALDLGYAPEAETHYRGRDCYLDTSDFGAIGYVKIATSWFIYPLPDKSDAAGRRLLAIAEDSTTPRTGDRVTALGCLSNRYDMRYLAGFDFTVGLNSSFRLGEGATPFAAVRSCLRAKEMGSRYIVRVDPVTEVEEFLPSDAFERIPSPKDHTPPDVCWAKFPVGGPCGVSG